MKANKVYITVQCSVSPDGITCPNKIRWGDGRVWKIERVLHTCRSPDLSFEGVRYAVLIGGTEKYLYRDDEKNWYVYVA
jgi:hypothetical protein